MTTHDRGKIIAAAREADFTDKQWEVMTYETGPYDITEATTELERLYAISFEDGRQAEREECAKVCEDEACGGSAFNSAANYMAKAIRARGDRK